MDTETKVYFALGDLVAESGHAKVYSMDEQLFLEIGPGHNLWALESEYTDYMPQLMHKPKGNCLEIGLGLGVASRCIMTFPAVNHLTTVEKNKDVIATHNATIYILEGRVNKWESYNKSKHSIVNQEGLNYLLTTTEKYDFIFMDFYIHIDEDTLPVIKDMASAAKRCLNKGGIISGWLDPYTPLEFYKEFEDIFSTT
jgi:spermidine synthase